MASFSVKESDLRDILLANTLRTRVPQVGVVRKVAPAPPRYRNEVSKYIIRRNHDCIGCGKCAQLCPYGVHVRKPGYKYFCEPKSYHCVGPACEKTDHYCVAACPKSALQIIENPMMQILGDYRWPADMILASWMMAETGHVPPKEYGFNYQCGNSGGGFDKLRFKFPEKPPVNVPKDQIDTSLELNRRGADGVAIGTAELVALGCVRCSRRESGRGCPRGIATTDPELSGTMDVKWGTQRVTNLYNAWHDELVDILWRFGMRSVGELRGRTDLLMHLDYTNDVEQ